MRQIQRNPIWNAHLSIPKAQYSLLLGASKAGQHEGLAIGHIFQNKTLGLKKVGMEFAWYFVHTYKRRPQQCLCPQSPWELLLMRRHSDHISYFPTVPRCRFERNVEKHGRGQQKFDVANQVAEHIHNSCAIEKKKVRGRRAQTGSGYRSPFLFSRFDRWEGVI